MITELLAVFVDLAVLAFNGLLLTRVILSWFMTPEHRVLSWLVEVTEPLLSPVRSLLPKTGMIDLAPLVTFMLLQLVQLGAHTLLLRLAG